MRPAQRASYPARPCCRRYRECRLGVCADFLDRQKRKASVDVLWAAFCPNPLRVHAFFRQMRGDCRGVSTMRDNGTIALNPQLTGNVGLYYCCYRLSLLGWNVMPTARN